MKQITSFDIDFSDLLAASSTRELRITGDPGSKFILYISNENPHYYNFETDTFAAVETRLIEEIPDKGVFIKKIKFPTITDDDQYDFQLIANPYYNVKLSESLSPSNSIYYRTKILQKANTVLTFAVATTTSGDFQTMPTSVTLTKPPLSTDEHIVNINWTITSVAAATGSGLKITRQPVDTDFKFSVAHDSIGSGSSSTTINLDSVENLVTGMALTTIESGSVSGSPTISSISEESKSVTVSVAQSWSSGKDITFQGAGIIDLSNALDTIISIIDDAFKLSLVTHTATVDGTVDSATEIILDEIHGIRAGASYTGVGINNASENVVTNVDYAGKTITTTTSQGVTDGTILTFDGCSPRATITTKIKVNKIPKDNIALTLDLDSILTSSITA